MFEQLAPIVGQHERQAHLPERGMRLTVKLAGHVHEIKVGDGLESRENAVGQLVKPHLGIEPVTRDNRWIERRQAAGVVGSDPPEVAREHSVRLGRPLIAAIGVVACREGIDRHLPFLEDKILQHFPPSVNLAQEGAVKSVARLHALIADALGVEIVEQAIFPLRHPLKMLQGGIFIAGRVLVDGHQLHFVTVGQAQESLHVLLTRGDDTDIQLASGRQEAALAQRLQLGGGQQLPPTGAINMVYAINGPSVLRSVFPRGEVGLLIDVEKAVCPAAQRVTHGRDPPSMTG